jgi:putative sterol carrier protein
MNGKMDDAELTALKAAAPDEKLDFVVTCAYETKKAVEAIPDQIADAIKSQRRKDWKRIVLVAGTIATLISLASPYVLAACR